MISLSFHLLFPQCALFLGGVLSILSGQAGAEVREPQMSPLRTDRGLGLTVHVYTLYLLYRYCHDLNRSHAINGGPAQHGSTRIGRSGVTCGRKNGVVCTLEYILYVIMGIFSSSHHAKF